MALDLERKLLTRIAKKNGGMLKVDDVLEEAQDVNSILHKHFEWDDSVAAASYRREQARALIQRCRITLVESEPMHIRAFVSLPADRDAGGGYRLTTTVLGDGNMREELLHDMRLTIARWSKQLNLLDSMTAELVLKLEEQIGAPQTRGKAREKSRAAA